MNADRQTDRLPVDGFCPKFDRNLQMMCKDHIPNFITLSSNSYRVDRQTDIIPKLRFLDLVDRKYEKDLTCERYRDRYPAPPPNCRVDKVSVDNQLDASNEDKAR
ncbi:hypothetical protein AVEN_156789-1 [Araneus ventricosus]|uniref:Uncharacterized protein n=1 Tax=Araneus ventricosus TaxID=182803 RepID=A0A4Y2R038_ARAVE|nr:hypothetical protein AVEN_156789-1 [Araneus ventricosus]